VRRGRSHPVDRHRPERVTAVRDGQPGLVRLPGLRGYPDAGAAALVVSAASIYLQDVRLRRWWQPVVIGPCLALALLFQHQFLYDAVVFFACMAILTAVTAQQTYRNASA
jgi:hypothetical protein